MNLPDLTHWVDARGATLELMCEASLLWVAARLPTEKGRHQPWIAEAQVGDDLLKLKRRWCEDSLPRRGAGREFRERISHTFHSVLVVTEAQRLSANALKGIWPFAEEHAPVILIGSVVDIAAKLNHRTRQRAHLLVETTSFTK